MKWWLVLSRKTVNTAVSARQNRYFVPPPPPGFGDASSLAVQRRSGCLNFYRDTDADVVLAFGNNPACSSIWDHRNTGFYGIELNAVFAEIGIVRVTVKAQDPSFNSSLGFIKDQINGPLTRS